MNGTGQQIMFTAISMRLKNYSGRKTLCKAIGYILSTIQMVWSMSLCCLWTGNISAILCSMVSLSYCWFLHQQEKTQEVVRLPLSAVKDCYNLILHPSPLSLTRQPNDGTFEIIWPEQIHFAISSRETLNFRDGDKLYFSIWYEDPDYREETLVRSAQDGMILERFSGDIRIMPNSERWLIK